MSANQANQVNAVPSEAKANELEVRRRNLRLALILASIAAVFFVGFITKFVLLSKMH